MPHSKFLVLKATLRLTIITLLLMVLSESSPFTRKKRKRKVLLTRLEKLMIIDAGSYKRREDILRVLDELDGLRS